jgi:general secretion pathway protein K
VPHAVIERAQPFLTVFSNRPQVNILETAPEVVAALPGMTSDRVRAVLAQQQAFPEDGQALLSMLGSARQYASTEGSKALRILAQIGFSNGHRMTSEVVILVFDNSNEPYSILSWQGDLAGSRPTEEMKRGRL